MTSDCPQQRRAVRMETVRLEDDRVVERDGNALLVHRAFRKRRMIDRHAGRSVHSRLANARFGGCGEGARSPGRTERAEDWSASVYAKRPPILAFSARTENLLLARTSCPGAVGSRLRCGSLNEYADQPSPQCRARERRGRLCPLLRKSPFLRSCRTSSSAEQDLPPPPPTDRRAPPARKRL